MKQVSLSEMQYYTTLVDDLYKINGANIERFKVFTVTCYRNVKNINLQNIKTRFRQEIGWVWEKIRVLGETIHGDFWFHAGHE